MGHFLLQHLVTLLPPLSRFRTNTIEHILSLFPYQPFTLIETVFCNFLHFSFTKWQNSLLLARSNLGAHFEKQNCIIQEAFVLLKSLPITWYHERKKVIRNLRYWWMFKTSINLSLIVWSELMQSSKCCIQQLLWISYWSASYSDKSFIINASGHFWKVLTNREAKTTKNIKCKFDRKKKVGGGGECLKSAANDDLMPIWKHF